MTHPQHNEHPGELRARSTLIDALSSSLDRGRNGLASVPGLLRQVIEGEKWRHFETMRGEEVRYDDFRAFLLTPPLKGLGATEETIRRLLADDIKTLDLLDQVLQRPPGRPAAEAAAQPQDESQRRDNETVDNVNALLPRPSGNSRARAVRQLREQRPDLLAQVEAGQLPSVHAAMVAAGFRERTVSVPVSQPEKIARALRKNLSEDDIVVLVRLLSPVREAAEEAEDA